MPSFGRYNPFPLTFGGGASRWETEHAALLDALADTYDPAEETASWVELYAYALAAAMVWAINARVAGQALPARMLEALPTWEEVCKLRPGPTDSMQARRARVAAKLRGVADNTLGGIYDSCAALAGGLFVEVRTVTLANEIAYWPGVNPGPPGYEWSSNRATFAVVLTRGSLGDADFRDLVERTYQMLDAMAPAWMTFQVGIAGGGFICGKGIVGLTLL